MKLITITILVLLSSLVNGQDTIGIKKATSTLNNALVTKDTTVLKRLISSRIGYGHSNGWLQTKQDIIADFVSGKIEYKKIETAEENYTFSKKAVAIRSVTKVEGRINGSIFNMTLQVLQVWKKVKRNWVLIARQSVKMS